jgi:hypothetical protein
LALGSSGGTLSAEFQLNGGELAQVDGAAGLIYGVACISPKLYA